jgi:hypothetical protein
VVCEKRIRTVSHKGHNCIILEWGCHRQLRCNTSTWLTRSPLHQTFISLMVSKQLRSTDLVGVGEGPS